MRRAWEVSALGEVCRFIDYRGKTPNKTPCGLRLITAKNVKLGYLRRAPLEFVDPKIYDAWMTRGLPTVGDVLFTTEAPLANVAQLDTDERVVFAQRIIILQPDKTKLDGTYLKYLLLSDSARDQIFRHGTGATVQGIKASLLKSVVISFPGLPEQQRIVAILDEAIAAIATAKANTEKNLQNARALFQRELASIFQDSPNCPIDPLSTLLSEQPRNGWSPPAEFQTGTGTPVLTLSAVTGFYYDGSKFKLSSVPTTKGAHYWLNPGELLITRSNTRELVGHVAVYNGTPNPAICCDLIMKMRVDPSRAETRYVYYALRSPGTRDFLTTVAHGASSTMKKISKGIVQSIPVQRRQLGDQRNIVANLDALRAETHRLESLYRRKIAALDELKKSLLHQAFNGDL